VKTAIRKITSLFYLLLGILPLLFILIITVKKENIHHKMRGKLKNQLLQTITLPENAVVWMDKHEIWVNNTMFDIHSKKLENGIYTFTGLYDDDETELVMHQQGTTEKDKQQNKLLAQFFKSLPVFWIQYDLTFNPSLKSYCYMVLGSQNIVEPFQKIPTPPPQVIATI
jgi:hypothetical protein